MAKQTTFRIAEARSEDNISLSFGLMELVRSCFKRLDLYDFLSRFKSKGVPLGFVVELICIHHLDGGDSMRRFDTLSSNPIAVSELCHGHHISQRTMNRALEDLDLYFEEITVHIWEMLQKIYPIQCTDVYVDGSHIEANGLAGDLSEYGEGCGRIQAQIQFMLASLVDPMIPLLMEAYPGNLNDPVQYSDFIPQLMFMLRKGSMIIMDHGGSSKRILDDIRSNGMDFLTRVKMNESDDRVMKEQLHRMEYVGRGIGCIRNTFGSSGRTNYLFFSVDKYILGIHAEERRMRRELENLEFAREMSRSPDVKRLVKVTKNPFFDVKVSKVELRMTLDPWLDEDIVKALGDIDPRCGWFKLQCSRPLDSKEALERYRGRVGIEHMTSSVKSVVNLKPLRVWKGSSVRGAMMLAFIAQVCVSMVRHDLEPDVFEKMVDGKMTTIHHRPSTKTICDELSHLTVTYFSRDGWGLDYVISNKTSLTERIFKVLEGYLGNISDKNGC